MDIAGLVGIGPRAHEAHALAIGWLRGFWPIRRLACPCDPRLLDLRHGTWIITPSSRRLLLSLRQRGYRKRPRDQGRQTWGYDLPQQFLIFDRDAKFNADIVATVKDHGILPIRTAFRSPWQNGVAERWVGSVRRDLLVNRVDPVKSKYDRAYAASDELNAGNWYLPHPQVAPWVNEFL